MARRILETKQLLETREAKTRRRKRALAVDGGGRGSAVAAVAGSLARPLVDAELLCLRLREGAQLLDAH